jgi:hypothetical protein
MQTTLYDGWLWGFFAIKLRNSWTVLNKDAYYDDFVPICSYRKLDQIKLQAVLLCTIQYNTTFKQSKEETDITSGGDKIQSNDIK